MANQPLISLVLPTFNEEDNIDTLYNRIKSVLSSLSTYKFEIIFIDNASTDNTLNKIKAIASIDGSVKIIANTRNFGHIRSPYYGILQSSGDATIYMASDLQDPPELIPSFIEEWSKGYKVVMAVKPKATKKSWFNNLRRIYYAVVDSISDVKLVRDATGFGLYDKIVIDELRAVSDPYPFLRGLVCEFGFPTQTVTFTQPQRHRGISKNNFYTLYDIAWLGLISHSRLPIRLATMTGFVIGVASIALGFVFFVLKLMFWNEYPMGIGPLAIGLFFLFGLQMVFIGILGEYVASIHTYVQRRPVVVEKERINF
jgi:glycosyltransferase involved in cell wall biosynthesis